MASEDLCIVCAEPLEWTGFGSCGHKETCSRCIARMRSVLKDDRCCYCQQPLPAVFVTRFMGDYTQTIPAGDFDGLQAKANAGQLQYLDSAQAYFDDPGHFREISSLCSYTHPKVWEDDPGGRHKTFRNLQQLKQHLVQHHNLQFCNICLEGRKVFLAEQCLYSKAELERHMKQGDVAGAMAESGFRGHPECRFCRKRYYGENELYTHMHTGHEQCFLCRRADPNRFVYYRDYADLENHFRHDHFLCRHPTCLERKFVVFPSEQELKQHMAREHSGEMTKAEKRQALTIPVNFSYRRGDGGAPSTADAGPSASHDLAAAAAMGRAIMIGGGAPGAGVASRFGRRGGSRGNLRAEELAQTAQAVQASLESAQTETAMRHSASQPNLQAGGGGDPGRPGPAASGAQTAAAEGGPALALTEADFPLPQGASGPGRGAVAGGQWAGASSSGVGVAAALRPEDFPALPGMSKAGKKKAKAKKSMAQALGAGLSGGVRVVNVGGGARAAPALRDESSFPTLRNSASMPTLSPDAAGPCQPPEPEPEAEPEWQEVAPPRLSQRQLLAQQRLEAKHAKDRQKAAAAPVAAQPALPPRQLVAAPARPPTPMQEAQVPTPAPEQQQRRRQDQFPALPRQQPAAAPPALAPATAPAGGGGGPGISEALRAANKALVERIKRQLDAGQFATFRQRSMEWMKGQVDSSQYHQQDYRPDWVPRRPQVAALGLVALVPDLAATCPDAEKRAELLAVHAGAFQDGSPQGMSGQWVPPEAAAAAAAHAEQHSSWQCGVCTLLNAPSARNCEACGHPKPRPDMEAGNQWRQQQQQQQAAFPGGSLSAPGSSLDGDPSLPPLQQSGPGGGKGRKGGKAGASGASSSGGGSGTGAPQQAQQAASFSAAAARASAAARSTGGSSSTAGGGSRPISPLDDFPALGGEFPALGSGNSSGPAAPSAAEPSQPAGEEEGGSEDWPAAVVGAGNGKKKGKQKKQPKFERLRLTGGDPATKQWLEQESRKTHPQNAWSHGVPAAAAAAAPAAPLARGPWAGQGSGKLAQQERAMLDAWAKK